MSNILIINAHHPYPFSPGKLNAAFTGVARDTLTEKGHQVRVVNVGETVDVATELANHQWAECIILQSPVNWMGVPWPFKKYMDEVYTAGMDGTLCNGDGRHSDAPQENYGTGGTLKGKRYMLSLTFNAPAKAFGVPGEYLFQGKSVDDLFFPMHMNFRFFSMEALPTFACFDVMKNPKVEADMARFRKHINSYF
ncbi:MAG: NAD(P)H-dependent oxidoreductase [Alcanivoracaceae bacterium]|nr:NAD(P)H-dependent oxidoreductase [Alcanivoracaceae bacterium]